MFEKFSTGFDPRVSGFHRQLLITVALCSSVTPSVHPVTFSTPELPVLVARSHSMQVCAGMRARYVCDPEDPAMFHICLGRKRFTMICPGELHFNERTQTCDWPEYANCRRSSTSLPPYLSPPPTPSSSSFLVELAYDSGIKLPASPEDALDLTNQRQNTKNNNNNSTGSEDSKKVNDLSLREKVFLMKTSESPASFSDRRKIGPAYKVAYTAKQTAEPLLSRLKKEKSVKSRLRSLVQGHIKKRSRLYRPSLLSGDKPSSSQWWNDPVLTPPASETSSSYNKSHSDDHAGKLIQPYRAKIPPKALYLLPEIEKDIKITRLPLEYRTQKTHKRPAVKAISQFHRSAMKVPWYRPRNLAKNYAAATASHSFKTRTSRESIRAPRRPVLVSPFKPFTRPPVALSRLPSYHATNTVDKAYLISSVTPMGRWFNKSSAMDKSNEVLNFDLIQTRKGILKGNKQDLTSKRDVNSNIIKDFHRPYVTFEEEPYNIFKSRYLSAPHKMAVDMNELYDTVQRPSPRWGSHRLTLSPEVIAVGKLNRKYKRHEPSSYASALGNINLSPAFETGVANEASPYNKTTFDVQISDSFKQYTSAPTIYTSQYKPGEYHSKDSNLIKDWTSVHGVARIPDYNPALASRYYTTLDLATSKAFTLPEKITVSDSSSIGEFTTRQTTRTMADEIPGNPTTKSNARIQRRPLPVARQHRQHTYVDHGRFSVDQAKDMKRHAVRSGSSNARDHDLALMRRKYAYLIRSPAADHHSPNQKGFLDKMHTAINNAAGKRDKRIPKKKNVRRKSKKTFGNRQFEAQKKQRSLSDKAKVQPRNYRRQPRGSRGSWHRSLLPQVYQHPQSEPMVIQQTPRVQNAVRWQNETYSSHSNSRMEKMIPKSVFSSFVQRNTNNSQKNGGSKTSLTLTPNDRHAPMQDMPSSVYRTWLTNTVPEATQMSQVGQKSTARVTKRVTEEEYHNRVQTKLAPWRKERQLYRSTASPRKDQNTRKAGPSLTTAQDAENKNVLTQSSSSAWYSDTPMPGSQGSKKARSSSFGTQAVRHSTTNNQRFSHASVTSSSDEDFHRNKLAADDQYYRDSPQHAHLYNNLPLQDFALITRALIPPPIYDGARTKSSSSRGGHHHGHHQRYPVTLNYALHGSRLTRRPPSKRIFTLHKPDHAGSIAGLGGAETKDFGKHSLYGLKRPMGKEGNPLKSYSPVALRDLRFNLIDKEENHDPREMLPKTSPVEKYKTRKGRCSKTWCNLPSCRCIGTDIPGDLEPEEIPQMVMLTFDDSINIQNIKYYRRLFNGTLKNPNGCPIKSTFFVSGDNSNYKLVKEVHSQGHEIASHTLSHRSPTTWWAYAGYDNWHNEVVGMRERLHKNSGIPREDIVGMRAPFLQVGGDAQYAMLAENNFRYDTSMVTGNLRNNKKPPVWPFTLDKAPDSQTCTLTPCPRRSYPGLWEVPLVRWYGSNKMACAMPDACTSGAGVKGSRKFFEENFKRHYETNRAPFGIFIHASWFARQSGSLEGLTQFLESLSQKDDVWVISVSQTLDWVQHPLPLAKLASLKSWRC